MSEFERIKIKQFGLQRSGTNLIKHLMEATFEVDVLASVGSWKHGMCDEFHQKSHVIVITKDVYSWLDSAFRFWVLPELSGFDENVVSREFSLFLRNPFRFEHANSPDPISHWNLMNRHWLNLKIDPFRVFHFRYEDLLSSETAEVELIEVGKCLGLSRASLGFARPACRMGIGWEETEITTDPFDENFYLSKSYLNRFSADDFKWVEGRHDPGLRARMGYPPFCRP